ncbi:hypothetical protein ACLMJK_007859 [Lecanora helva]
MTLRLLRQQRRASPFAFGAFAIAALLYPHSTVHAESPPEDHISRKPIYDNLTFTRQPLKPNLTSNDDAITSPRSPTPTDRLAEQIGRIRRSIYNGSAWTEDSVNAAMSSFLHQEQAFTQTIASLAPGPETQERILPGALYVLVAAMAGSIVSRNRNILIRASAPIAIGIGAAWYVLPYTTRNVADLVWTYEERAPIVAENHMRVRGAVEEGWRQAKIRAESTKTWSESRVKDSREVLEKWVKKGS